MTLAPFANERHDSIDVFDVLTPHEAQHAEPLFEVNVEHRSPERATVWASGEIDVLAASDVQNAVDEALRSADSVHVELSSVTFLCSRAVCVLAEHPAASDGRMSVHAPTRHTRMLFELFGAQGLLA
ncbi:STAS domain-containing protein [Gordonia soli]|uniref:MlaB-like STAS domain-containing protein n=1 Tax=Gordonia soli NBRC 108243 TaxID=1223545 RepID=M0QIV4_9ACTN|nr:STAS domain-containing protein [Gordonia soli]GAC68359.1 hypothetical protein GS4_15_00080 [Gordonia soli NBRC 108243]